MYKNFSKVYDKFMEYSDYGAWEKQIEELIAIEKPEGNRLLELGCGTGELLLRMAKNYRCDGLDLSPEMLTIAQKKLKHRDVKLFLGDMVEFSTGEKYDIILAMFDTVNHLVSIEELEEHFKSVKASLNNEGIYIFDVVDREFMNTMFKGGVFVDNRKDFSCIWEHQVEDGIDYIEATYFLKISKNAWERYTENYSKKIFTFEEIEKIAKDSGLAVIKKIENNKIAGKRYIYLLKNSEHF